MKTLRSTRVLGTVVLLMGSVATVQAQAPGYQLIASPAGYQYEVPSDWQLGTSTGGAGSEAASADGSELAYVAVVPPPPAGSGTDETSNEVLQAITDAAITGEASQSDSVVTETAVPATVPGADAADQGMVAYSDGNGTMTDEDILTAVRGLTGYTLVVSLPAGVDAGATGIGTAILNSFAVTGDAQPSGGTSG